MRKGTDTARAAKALAEGGIILYPTDTLYGLGADAMSTEAVQKVYEMKGRPKGKPIHVVVADLDMAKRYVEMTPLARSLAERFLPGPLTLVLAAKPGVPDILTTGTGTLGIRVPNNAFCLALAREFGRAFTATSANASGGADPHSVMDAKTSLGSAFERIACVVDAGILPPSAPSTVVDARGEWPAVLREGAISGNEIVKIVSKYPPNAST